jgi:demethylmenaquinone methyltransferase/2-methoxy-6-polyprenyl-1,4-benzoquinol methylase
MMTYVKALQHLEIRSTSRAVAPHDRIGEAELTQAQTESVLELMNRFQEPEVRPWLSELAMPPGSRGLDVGCGMGLYAVWLASVVGHRGHVVAIDPSPERIAEAQATFKDASEAERITLRQGSGTAIDEPDQHFDWVWCSDVLHHIDEAVRAVTEFKRVTRPGGTIYIKESQVLPALLLPGHLDLERQLQRADVEFQKREAGERSFQERRQRTYETLLEAGLRDIRVETRLIQRQAPLDEATKRYIQTGIFDRTWGPRIRDWLSDAEWALRSALCEADASHAILKRRDYYCLYPVTLFCVQV